MNFKWSLALVELVEVVVAPEVPPEPHTEEQHEEIEQWNTKLQELMKRERHYASSS